MAAVEGGGGSVSVVEGKGTMTKVLILWQVMFWLGMAAAFWPSRKRVM